LADNLALSPGGLMLCAWHERFNRFLEKFEIWIYAMLGVWAAVYPKVFVAWNECASRFGLEREASQRRLWARH
jgi:hypothetical protein